MTVDGFRRRCRRFLNIPENKENESETEESEDEETEDLKYEDLIDEKGDIK